MAYQMIEDHFDERANNYESNMCNLYGGEVWEALVRNITINDGEIILDVGTGTGMVLFKLAERTCPNFQGIGLDISAKMLGIAMHRMRLCGISNLLFQRANAAYLPFKDERFDVAISHLCIGYFKNPVKTLDEMYRVLKRNGSLYISDMFYPDKHSSRKEFISGNDAQSNGTLLRTYSKKKLVGLSQRSGFNVVEVREIPLASSSDVAWDLLKRTGNHSINPIKPEILLDNLISLTESFSGGETALVPPSLLLIKGKKLN